MDSSGSTYQNLFALTTQLKMDRLLVEVPGGIIKVQEYVPVDPDTDWATTLPSRSIARAYRQNGPLGGLDKAQELILRHGARGILLEMEGRMLVELRRLYEARDSLERAQAAYRLESRAGLLRAGLTLSQVHREVYSQNRWKGADAVMTLDIPGIGPYRQVVFGDPKTGANEDTLEDRAMYVLFELLATEPYFAPALVMLAEEMASSRISSDCVPPLLEMVAQVDPGREDVQSLHAFYNASSGPQPSLKAVSAIKSHAESQSQGPPEPPQIPENAAGWMDEFDRNYRPEPTTGQIAEARMASAEANFRQGRFDEAERAARDAVRIAPEIPAVYTTLSRILCAGDKPDEARDVLQAVVKHMPYNAELRVELGFMHLHGNRLDEARAEFLRARVSDPPEPWRVYLGLGLTYRKLGQRDEGLRHLWGAHTAVPNDPRVALQLAYALRDRDAGASADDLELALGVINHSIDNQPDDVELLVCRAQLLCAVDRFSEAIPELERAAELSPTHPIAGRLLKALREEML